jgi:hypothetical protein
MINQTPTAQAGGPMVRHLNAVMHTQQSTDPDDIVVVEGSTSHPVMRAFMQNELEQERHAGFHRRTHPSMEKSHVA